MSFNNNNRQTPYIKNDRFGNKFQLKTAMEKVDKKTGEVVENCFSTFVEIGKSLYKIEISPRVKETKSGGNAVWVKVTALKAQQQNTSM